VGNQAHRAETRLMKNGNTAMEQKTTTHVVSSSEIWEPLEVLVREHVQRFIQALLEEEVTALLGPPTSARRATVDGAAGMRNGYGKPRRLSLTAGTITVRRPRARELAERFVSRVLPLFKRRTREVGELLPQLYLHGLALRQAIWRKDDPHRHVCGILQTLYTDCGSDFTSQHLQHVSADLKICLINSTPWQPRGRGRIERFFQTVQEMPLCALPGYAPPRGRVRGHPQLTLRELEVRFRAFVLDVYHLMIDETDRLKTASLEQVRDIFDGGEIGVVLIGVPVEYPRTF
jgi:hypothetical protein